MGVLGGGMCVVVVVVGRESTGGFSGVSVLGTRGRQMVVGVARWGA